MNEPNLPTSSTATAGISVPPVIPPGAGNPPPAEPRPIRGFLGAAEAMLRHPQHVIHYLRQPDSSKLIVYLVTISVVCGLVYGVIVGTFSGGPQLWQAPVKIVGGMLLSAFICLPSLYIFACLSGSTARVADVCGALMGFLALMTVLLIGFAPVAWVFSQSTKSLVVMGALHIGFWLVATIFGLRFLHSAFRQLNSRSNLGFQVWVVIFLLVALQMTTALRPILGRSDRFLPQASEKKFFLEHWVDCLRADAQGAPPPTRYE